MNDDSALKMALDLYNGCCMYGDIALTESTLSIREFYHLVEAGVRTLECDMVLVDGVTSRINRG
jgi:hypothetical protein